MLRMWMWLACVGLAVGCGDAGTKTSPGSSVRPEEQGGPFSVQLHVHGSFSEGIGSIDSHSHEANDLGVDVIWWSDHDFRITSHHHVTTFAFDDVKQRIDEGETWTARPDRERFFEQRQWKFLSPDERHQSPSGASEFVDEDPFEGERALRLATSSQRRRFERHAFTFAAPRDVHRRPLASSVVLRLAVFPEAIGPDARGVIEIDLSEHAPRNGRGLEPYALRYVLENEGEPRWDGTTWVVPVPYREREWNALELPLTTDAIDAFQGWLGEDNSLHAISFGVEARNGARASVRFDALEIVQARAGAAAYDRQAALIQEAMILHGGAEQLQGIEITYASEHLNEFSLGTELLDYDALEELSDTAAPPIEDAEAYRGFVARHAVEAVHARGGLVSFNHMYGASVHSRGRRVKSREEVLAHLRDTRLYGADLLEVGYRMRGGHPIEDHLWVWDQLTLSDIHAVGIGVSDSHGGSDERWRDGTNNFVSWIYAKSTAKADLIEGLRNGRVFFGDPARFDGQLDLRTDAGDLMGSTVQTRADTTAVTVDISPLEEGDEVTVIVAGEVAAKETASAGAFQLRHDVDTRSEGRTFVRVEVRASDGVPKLFSNPIYFERTR